MGVGSPGGTRSVAFSPVPLVPLVTAQCESIVTVCPLPDMKLVGFPVRIEAEK